MLSKQLYRIYCAVYSGGRGGGVGTRSRIQRLHTTQRYQNSSIKPSALVDFTSVIYSTCLFTLYSFLTLPLIPSLLPSHIGFTL